MLRLDRPRRVFQLTVKLGRHCDRGSVLVSSSNEEDEDMWMLAAEVFDTQTIAWHS